MSIYIGNDSEDRLEALEAENASLKKYNEYRQIVVVMYYTPGHLCPGCVVHHYSQFYGKIFWNVEISQTNSKK